MTMGHLSFLPTHCDMEIGLFLRLLTICGCPSEMCGANAYGVEYDGFSVDVCAFS